jgi:hypothetical protein
MTTRWHSLYWTLNLLPRDTLIARLTDALDAAGYTRYNPFGLIPSASYTDTVRLFVAPSDANATWGRVLSAQPLPDALIAAAFTDAVTVSADVTDTDATLAVYAEDGQPSRTPVTALAKYAGKVTLKAVFGGGTPLPLREVKADAPQVVPLDALPEDVQALAGDVDAGALKGMFDRVAGGMFKRTGGDSERDQARELLEQASRTPDWNTPAAVQVRQLLTLLWGDDGWMTPDFKTLRDAYALHARLQRNPQARQYPGDAESMAAVPNALDYHPLYAGRDT